MFGWATTLFFAMRDLYLDVRLARYDLGNMTQAVWSTAHGRVLEVTDGVTGEQLTRVGQHVDPILAALTPFWIVAPSPMTLVAVQIVAVALGALPVLWLGRRYLGSERDAALLALAYLAYPWMAWVAMDGFHPLTLTIPLLLFGIWFLDSDRLVPFALCAVAAATCGELVGVWIAALGLWYAFARGRRRPGLMISVVGLVWTAVAVRAVVPAFSGESSDYFGVYDAVGGSPLGVVRTALTDPLTILSAVTHGGDVFYVLMLAIPLAGMFLLAPALAAVALPQFAAALLAGFPATTDPRAHYIAGIVPFLVAATVLGLGRLSEVGRRRGVVLVLTLCVAFAVVLGPWPGTPGRSITSYWADVPSARVDALRRAVALVPAGAPASATNRLGSQLAERQYFYSVPVVSRAEWIVVDTDDAWIPRRFGGEPDPAALAAFVMRIRQDADWVNVFEKDGVLVFRKADA
jgi:uncharacterized membrane protein